MKYSKKKGLVSLIKRIVKFAVFIVSAALLVSGSASISGKAKPAKSWIKASIVTNGNMVDYVISPKVKRAKDAEVIPTYSIITNGNVLKLKAGDIVSLKNGNAIPAELKQIKVKSVSKTTERDIYDYLRESLPASKFKKPYTISFSLTSSQITAFGKLHKDIMLNKIKLVLVRHSAS